MLIRKRAQVLGIVEAPNQQAAERAATEFQLLSPSRRLKNRARNEA